MSCEPFPLTVAQVAEAAYRSTRGVERMHAERFARDLVAVAADFGLTTKNRVGHFIAQCAVESAWFRTTTEYADGRAYEGRRDLGNVYRGDGPRYRGRGYIQVTGRANYRMVTAALRQRYPQGVTWRGAVLPVPDFEDEPERLASAPWAVLASLTWWDRNGANAEIDRHGDTLRAVQRISRGVNRGSYSSSREANGEAHRIDAFRSVMAVLHVAWPE